MKLVCFLPLLIERPLELEYFVKSALRMSRMRREPIQPMPKYSRFWFNGRMSCVRFIDLCWPRTAHVKVYGARLMFEQLSRITRSYSKLIPITLISFRIFNLFRPEHCKKEKNDEINIDKEWKKRYCNKCDIETTMRKRIFV